MLETQDINKHKNPRRKVEKQTTSYTYNEERRECGEEEREKRTRSLKNI